MIRSVAEPRIDRRLELHLQGDWGQANLHRICGWLSQEINDRAAEGSKIAIWSGRGGADALVEVAEGRVDAALCVPAAFAASAPHGIGPFAGKPILNLRALGTMPQTDRLVVALRADVGVDSFEALRDAKPALRIATSPDDGVNAIGFAAQRVMELAGIPRETLASWGGQYLERERPMDCTKLVLDGEADGIVHEAIMTGYWQELADGRDLVFLDVEDAVLAAMERDYHWPRATLPSGYLRGLERELETLDFSDFLMVAREDMPDDVAYLIAWCMCETRGKLERMYAHIPPARSPVTYPLDPARIARTSIDLHPGAAAYYEDAGLATGAWAPPAFAGE